MNAAQQHAFLYCVQQTDVDTENLMGWLNHYGWQVSPAGLDAYRNTLQQ